MLSLDYLDYYATRLDAGNFSRKSWAQILIQTTNELHSSFAQVV